MIKIKIPAPADCTHWCSAKHKRKWDNRTPGSGDKLCRHRVGTVKTLAGEVSVELWRAQSVEGADGKVDVRPSQILIETNGGSDPTLLTLTEVDEVSALIGKAKVLILAEEPALHYGFCVFSEGMPSESDDCRGGLDCVSYDAPVRLRLLGEKPLLACVEYSRTGPVVTVGQWGLPDSSWVFDPEEAELLGHHLLALSKLARTQAVRS